MSAATAFPNPDRSSFVDPPFAVPPDTILDIPVPPSVNRTRRLNTKWTGRVAAWKAHADTLLIASGQFRAARRHPVGERFEVTIVLCEEKCGLDLDNPIKAAVDYLRRIELIRDDDKRYMRGLHVVWGDAPTGCRLILRPAV